MSHATCPALARVMQGFCLVGTASGLVVVLLAREPALLIMATALVAAASVLFLAISPTEGWTWRCTWEAAYWRHSVPYKYNRWGSIHWTNPLQWKWYDRWHWAIGPFRYYRRSTRQSWPPGRPDNFALEA